MAAIPSIRSLLLAGLWLLGATVAPGQTPDVGHFARQTTLKPVMERAQKHLTERRFAEAAREAETCLRQLPDYHAAHFVLAQVAYEYRDFEGALGHVQIAEQNLRALAQAYQSQLDASRVQDEADLAEAETAYNSLSARGMDLLSCSGGVFHARQRAIDDLDAKKSHLHDQDGLLAIPAPYFLLHGNCLFRLGRRDEAVAHYRFAVQADPGLAPAWNNLLGLECQARDFAQARADLARAEAARVVIRPELKKAVLEAR